ncbi:MAG: HoxN/HupN/NixA family nickel/cobalt transporter [Gluconacetobacter diazotrophicus]|nr:HoxN/HupN/NixA family nickel/cobalt transporter [Gluconacetobacter diazotrophicus]
MPRVFPWPVRMPDGLRRRIVAVYAILLLLNLLAWLWAVTLFRHQPVLLGTALLAYGFGLRHAVDADHIAAIDNVTRRLMADGERPVGVGLFFALGHSAVVILATAAVAAAVTALSGTALAGSLDRFRSVGSIVGTAVSASFLFAIAIANLVVLRGVWRTYRHARRGGCAAEADPGGPPDGGGALATLFRPLFRLVRRSWHMFPLGFLFGLGFDTATEVALLGIGATEAARGVSAWAIMVFPALFAAGMSLIDTTDGILMLGAYDWALARPERRLGYNLVVTAVSVAVAAGVGGVEALGLLADRLDAKGRFRDAVGALNDRFDALGFAIVGLFVVCWIGSAIAFRYRGWTGTADAVSGKG